MIVALALALLSTATLQVSLPPEWSVQEAPLPIILTRTGGTTPGEQLSVAGTFIGSRNRNALPGDALVICKEDTGPCDSNVSFPGSGIQTVYLRHRQAIGAGVYAGQIVIHSATDRSEAKNLTLYVSSPYRIGMGIVFVIVGGLLAWWVRVFASHRVTRDQALLPVALYYERLSSLDVSLKSVAARANVATPNLSRAVTHWMGRLDINSLEGEFNLPRKSPSPFTPTPTISTSFTSFLAQTDTAIILLNIFIREGVELVLERSASGRLPSAKVPEVVRAIDARYEPQLQPEDARSKIRVILADAETPELAAAFPPSTDPTPPPPLNRLLIEIRRLNLTAWVVLLAVAAIGTIMTFVLKPGFGQLSDYLLCLITSFGVPMLGSVAIPSQTAALVSTSSQPVSGSKGSGAA